MSHRHHPVARRMDQHDRTMNVADVADRAGIGQPLAGPSLQPKPDGGCQRAGDAGVGQKIRDHPFGVREGRIAPDRRDTIFAVACRRDQARRGTHAFATQSDPPGIDAQPFGVPTQVVDRRGDIMGFVVSQGDETASAGFAMVSQVDRDDTKTGSAQRIGPLVHHRTAILRVVGKGPQAVLVAAETMDHDDARQRFWRPGVRFRRRVRANLGRSGRPDQPAGDPVRSVVGKDFQGDRLESAILGAFFRFAAVDPLGQQLAGDHKPHRRPGQQEDDGKPRRDRQSVGQLKIHEIRLVVDPGHGGRHFAAFARSPAGDTKKPACRDQGESRQTGLSRKFSSTLCKVKADDREWGGCAVASARRHHYGLPPRWLVQQ